MSLLSEKVKDKRVLNLIGKYLRSEIMENGVKRPSERGTPQGSPLSPLLSNIMLNELDDELTSRGLSFVRYADDFSLYVKSKKSAERVEKGVRKFLETELFLKVNESKSGIRRSTQMNLLGFGFYGSKTGFKIRLAKKSIKRFKAKLKEKTQRRYPISTKERILKLERLTTGWLHYFKIANCTNQLQRLDEWLRRRLRLCEWKLWKRVRTRHRKLTSLGLSSNQAHQWACTRKGLWRIANSPILKCSLTNAWMKSQGYESLSTKYKRIKVSV